MRVRAMVASAVAAAAVFTMVPQAGAATTANLVKNPGAEAGAGGNGQVVAIPNWSTIGPATVVTYGSAGFPNGSTPGPSSRGSRFFAGGPTNSDFGTRTMNQTVSLSNWAGKIATGAVDYELTAWLGGKGAIPDNAMVQLNFKNGAGSLVGGTVTLGPVTNSNRANQTKFIKRTKAGSVPSSARSVLVQVVMIDVDGGVVNAYADNVTFKLLNV